MIKAAAKIIGCQVIVVVGGVASKKLDDSN